MGKELWFKDGLQFSCVPGCRRCCGGAPGYVWVSEEEIDAIAVQLGLPLLEFKRKHVRYFTDGTASLKELANYDCEWLNAQGCSIYPVRPKQCRTYPFWPEVTRTERNWILEKERCPGLDQGRLHDAPQIVEILKTMEA